LTEIAGWKNLKKLYLYNTSVPEESVEAFRKTHEALEVYNTQFDLTDTVYNAQLRIPVIKIDSTFFHTRANIDVKPSRGKVKYYYTLDGTEPTSQSTLYTEPFQVKETGEFKVKATMEGWMDSDVATYRLLRIGIQPNVLLEVAPDPKYVHKRDSILVDGVSAGFDRNDKAYLGLVNKDLKVLFQIDKPETLSHLTISYFEDVERGVFPPQYVEVWGGDDKNHLKKLGEARPAIPKDKRPASKYLLKIDFPEQSVKCVRLIAKNINTLPAGIKYEKDTKPGLYVDEVSLE
jgi:hypothetical protein